MVNRKNQCQRHEATTETVVLIWLHGKKQSGGEACPRPVRRYRRRLAPGLGGEIKAEGPNPPPDSTVRNLCSFPTLSTIHLIRRWKPLCRTISTAVSRRQVADAKATTLDSDYSSTRSRSNEQRETIMLIGCHYCH
ncbi:hypothetical protein YC2023_083802 [Brassica napus]